MDDVAITLDVDWAPDYAIDLAARILVEREVRATWFITHASPAIDRLRQRPDLFELGIHPNFLPGSTHGGTESEVLEHCVALVPDAISMRTHGLYQSTSMLVRVMAETRIEVDVSLLLPWARRLAPVPFVWQGRTLLRVPYFWEDDIEMEALSPSWHLNEALLEEPGLKVFDFHPIHVMLNSSALAPYRRLCLPAGSLASGTEVEARPLVNQGEGTRTLFVELADRLERGGFQIRDLRDAA